MDRADEFSKCLRRIVDDDTVAKLLAKCLAQLVGDTGAPLGSFTDVRLGTVDGFDIGLRRARDKSLFEKRYIAASAFDEMILNVSEVPVCGEMYEFDSKQICSIVHFTLQPNDTILILESQNALSLLGGENGNAILLSARSDSLAPVHWMYSRDTGKREYGFSNDGRATEAILLMRSLAHIGVEVEWSLATTAAKSDNPSLAWLGITAALRIDPVRGVALAKSIAQKECSSIGDEIANLLDDLRQKVLAKGRSNGG